MVLEETIDLEIKKYFTYYLNNTLSINDVQYELKKAKRHCVFKIKMDGCWENLVVEYQEDWIGEYSIYFKTTASVEFFELFISQLFKVSIIDYKYRFECILSKIEHSLTKLKALKKISLVNDSFISIRNQVDKTYGIDYNVISSPRNISISINDNLYRQHKTHFFKSILYFSFKDGILDASCLLFNQSMRNEKLDKLELWLSSRDDIFAGNLRHFQKHLESFFIYEFFHPIHVHYGLPINQLMLMSEEELKPYADVIGMLHI